MTPETPVTYRPPAPPTALTPALYEAVIDLCWRAVQYGETDDGDTAYYLVTKGAMHRLIGAAQGAGIPAAFRGPFRNMADDKADVNPPASGS